MHWCDRPGMSYGKHKHDEDQSHWVISGKIEISIGNLSYELSEGDRDHMPIETYHSARVIGEEPVVYLVGEKIDKRETGSNLAVSEILVVDMIKMEKIFADYTTEDTDSGE